MSQMESGCDCAEAAAALDDLLRDELDCSAAERIRAHLQRCPDCTCLERFERAFRSRLRRLGESAPCCPERVRARITELLERERELRQA